MQLPEVLRSSVDKLVLHYDFFYQYSPIDGFAYLPDLIGRSSRVVVLTLCTSSEVLFERTTQRLIKALALSLDNKYVVLKLYNRYTRSSEIYYYQDSGSMLYQRELSKSFYGAEFIADQKVLLHSSDKWEIYRLNDLDTPFVSGKFRGNPSWSHPIIVVPQRDLFIIQSFDKEQSREGYRLQAVDNETGQVIAERFFEGDPLVEDFEFFRVTEQGTLEVWLNRNTIVELAIPR